MCALDIKELFRRAWQRTKQTEAAKEDDPVLKNVEVAVVRTIAELEVTRLERPIAVPVPAAEKAPEKPRSDDPDPTIPAAAA
jgi:hypothetical protein